MQDEKNNSDVTDEAVGDDECNDSEKKKRVKITLMRYLKKF